MATLERMEDNSPSTEAEPHVVDIGRDTCSSFLLHRIVYPALRTEDFRIREDLGVVVHREDVGDDNGTLRNQIAIIRVVL